MNLPLTPGIRARHEAGQVAMFLHLGLPIDYVTIAGDEGRTFPLPDSLHTDWQTLLIDLAGSAAALRQPVWASEHDSQTAYAAAGRIARTRGMPTYVIRDEGLAETKKVIRAAWSIVDAIAAALLEHETLSGDEVRRVVARVSTQRTRRGLGGCEQASRAKTCLPCRSSGASRKLCHYLV